MPIITVDNAGSLNSDQKKELIAQLTKVVSQVTGKSQQYVYVKINEIDRANFGIGGQPLG